MNWSLILPKSNLIHAFGGLHMFIIMSKIMHIQVIFLALTLFSLLFLFDFYMCTYARCPCMRENMTNISSFKSKDRFQNVHIKHCFWQVNQCVDCLVRMSFNLIADFFIYDSSSVDILDVFEGDLNRMYFNRICPESCFGA